MVVGFLGAILALSLTEEDRAVNAAQVGVQGLHTAVSHRRGHDLVLDLTGHEFLTGASQLDEVDFEGARWHVCHLVGEASKLRPVADHL